MRTDLRLVLILCCCLVPFTVQAQSSIPIITTDELKKIYDEKADFMLINALSPIENAEEHITGSVNIPFGFLKSGKAKLPENKGKKLVFYCKGPKCTKSGKTAGLAVKMGYTNVFVYNEGLPEWIKRGYPADLKTVYPKIEVPVISPEALKQMIDKKENIFILDIRDEEDMVAGSLKGAHVIDLVVLDANLSQVPKGKKIVIMDIHGKQSNIAGRFLASKGYTDVVRLDGGFVSGWIKAGYPVEK